jgi:uncharacterized protein (TIGR02145 family)
MKLYFLSVVAVGFLLLSAWSTGPAAIGDAKIRITDTVVVAGKVWMKNNVSLPAPNSFWYERDSVNNIGYGRLYFFSAAQRMCPDGWHIPTSEEWEELFAAYQLDSLNALPQLIKGGATRLELPLAGYRSANSKDDLFGYKDKWGFYWTSTVKGEQTAYAVWLNSQSGKVIQTYYRRANAFSVRYVRD